MADGRKKGSPGIFMGRAVQLCLLARNFGGLYLNFCARPLQPLITAEDLADRALYKEDEWLEMKHFDFDYDGKKEIVVSSPG